MESDDETKYTDSEYEYLDPDTMIVDEKEMEDAHLFNGGHVDTINTLPYYELYGHASDEAIHIYKNMRFRLYHTLDILNDRVRQDYRYLPVALRELDALKDEFEATTNRLYTHPRIINRDVYADFRNLYHVIDLAMDELRFVANSARQYQW